MGRERSRWICGLIHRPLRWGTFYVDIAVPGPGGPGAGGYGDTYIAGPFNFWPEYSDKVTPRV